MPSATTPGAHQERRERKRIPVRLLLAVSCGLEGARQAVLRDASETGISFFCDAAIPAGSPIEFSVQVPPDVAEIEKILVRGKGTVVRSEEQPSGRVLVAAITEKYELEE